MLCWSTSKFSVRRTFSESWHPRWRRWAWCAGCGPHARSSHGIVQTSDHSHFLAWILLLPPGQSLCQIRQPLWNQSNYIGTSSSFTYRIFVTKYILLEVASYCWYARPYKVTDSLSVSLTRFYRQKAWKRVQTHLKDLQSIKLNKQHRKKTTFNRY